MLLMIWSAANKRKSPYCTSAIGRMPIIAAPQATPKKPSSAMGVSIMRSGNFFSRPSVTVKAPPHPPGTAMSSPDAEHAFVALHFLGDGLAQGLGDTQSFCHGFPLRIRQNTSVVSSCRVGCGAAWQFPPPR